ncbi:hypothetical protein [Brevibacterium aurantiacum]|uniref:response regulator transcription factor n=1 Tax=Brevibacterium aurantiacum TaxID=273384 RepID=UPI0028C4CE04|nr:hypothetical protein [Brevibacterium aurantiacum]
MITVAVVDDQEMVRMGFSLILDSEDGISVIGQAADGVEAIELAGREKPTSPFSISACPASTVLPPCRT